MKFEIEEIKNYLRTLHPDSDLFDVIMEMTEVNVTKANLQKVFSFDLECQMTIEDFINSVKSREITSYDGFGCYGYIDGKTDIEVSFNTDFIKYAKQKFDFTHVYWYNK